MLKQINKSVIYIAAVVSFSSLVYADFTHFKLFILDPIGVSDASQCNLGSTNALLIPEKIKMTLTEQDVVTWDAKTAQWALNPKRFKRNDIESNMKDHCFYMMIDDKVLCGGVILSSHSSRLVKFPTIQLVSSHNGLYFELKSSHSNHDTLIFTDSLNDVFQK